MRIAFFLLSWFMSVAAFAEPSISGTSGTWAHGNSVTISGSGFGTKTTAAPVVWDMLEESSSMNTTATIGSWSETGQLSISTTSPRHARSTRHGHIDLRGQYQVSSAGYFTGGSDSTTWFAQYWVYLGPNFDFSGGSVVSDSRANIKFFRMWSTSSEQSNFVAAFHYGDRVCALTELCTDGVNNSASCYDATYNPSARLDDGGWHLLQFEYREGSVDGTDGVWRMWSDGELVYNYTTVKTQCSGHVSNKRPLVLGFYDSHSGNSQPSDFYIDDAYIDNTWARVELANNATYTSATIREIQPPTAWSSSSATITLNQGAFSNGATAYLFITDSTGARNTTGFPVTLSGGSAPVANFTCAPLTLQAPASTTCTDSSTNTPTSWSWTGDCGTSSSQNPSLSCSTGGLKDVCLVATNGSGSSSQFCRTDYVTARYKKPAAKPRRY